MCADSMLTHTVQTATGPIVTNFEHAEKLIALGQSLPAATMYSGQAVFVDESIAVVLKRVGRELDTVDTPDAKMISDKVKAAVDAVYRAKNSDNESRDSEAVEPAGFAGKIERGSEDAAGEPQACDRHRPIVECAWRRTLVHGEDVPRNARSIPSQCSRRARSPWRLPRSHSW